MNLESDQLEEVIRWIEEEGTSRAFYVKVPMYCIGSERWEWIRIHQQELLHVLRGRREHLRKNGGAGHRLNIKVNDSGVFIGKPECLVEVTEDGH